MTRAVSRSKPIPATIGMFFGGLWAFLAAMALPSDWRLPIATLAAVATVVLILRLWRLREPVSDTRGSLFSRKAYLIAVALEVLALYAASFLLPCFGLQSYFIQVVGIIVGLHFIGLWVATRSSRFLVIAAGMCVVSVLAIFLPATLHLVNLRDFVTGAGNALVLWSGASRSTAKEV